MTMQEAKEQVFDTWSYEKWCSYLRWIRTQPITAQNSLFDEFNVHWAALRLMGKK